MPAKSSRMGPPHTRGTQIVREAPAGTHHSPSRRCIRAVSDHGSVRAMGTTLLMSYPGPNWQIRGGENFRSRARSDTNPRQAMREWLSLCDAIMHAGGHILVMPPPPDAAAGAPGSTGLPFTADAGQLFPPPDGGGFLVSRLGVPHPGGRRGARGARLWER